MSKKTQGIIFLVLLSIVMLAGLNTLHYFMAKKLGISFDFFVVGTIMILSVGIGVAFAFGYLFYRKKRYGNIPAIDERTKVNVQKYINVMFTLLFLFISVSLIVLFFMDVEVVEVGLMSLFMGGFFIVFFIGLLIVRKV